MGYCRHHAIIVTSWDKVHINAAHVKAKEIFGDQVTELLPTATNGYQTFLIGPDGSKEWWPDSDKGDQRRKDFREWMEASKMYFDAAEVQYHDEENSLWIKGIPDLKENL